MHDDNKEEYVFEDLGAPDASEKEQIDYHNVQEPSRKINDVKKKIIIAAGLLFLGVVLYNFIITLFPSNKSGTAKEDIIAHPADNVTSSKDNTSPINSSTTHSENYSDLTMSSDTRQVGRSSQGDEQQVLLREEIVNLHVLAQELKKTIANLELKIADFDHSQIKIKERIKEIEQNAQFKPKPVTQKNTQSTPAKNEYYYIKAIIPGRVWLINEKGTTITLKLGDMFNKYGKVKRIDHEYGKVFMDNGYVFEFHPEDR